ncbi:hypothetical protein NE604_01915 [Anaerofustis stercorihominis]|uniref:LPXTG-motif cell wall anchor domain protein n=1 Tax=Anaerofustis stercorihominis DSM 17244 TaxID=445971 RepID=B1C7U7_9FIRM|nr:hypothetical protein [Anaerofustis stercorihominis]EDS73084.1 LPXTG-motif cell wall anchor domain protein [Anaerofustis stercorihominis DSM 17244]MCQ4794395.1 hypothetical protein [Anaerofustis stercorihominis]
MTGTYDFTQNNPKPGIVHAKFEKDTYEIYISPDIKGGTITANRKSAGVDDIVTLTVKEDKGYKLKNINIKGDVVDPIKLTKISDLKYQFKMPRSGIFVSADFKKVSDNTPIVKKGGNTKSSGTKITAAKKTTGSGIVKTGDENGDILSFYVILSLLSITGIAFIYRYKRQH